MADKSNAMTARPRAVAARVQGGGGGVSGHRGDAPVHRRAGDVHGEGPRRSSRSSSPTTCSATSSPTSAPRCRAGSAWRRPATCIRAGPRCSSRCTDRRRRWRGRTSPIPIGAILSAALMLETARPRQTRPRQSSAPCEAAVAAGQTTADIGGTLGTRERATRSHGMREDSSPQRPRHVAQLTAELRRATKEHAMSDRLHPRRRAHADGRVRRRAQGRLGDRARRHRRARARCERPASQPEWIDHVVFGNVHADERRRHLRRAPRRPQGRRADRGAGADRQPAVRIGHPGRGRAARSSFSSAKPTWSSPAASRA